MHTYIHTLINTQRRAFCRFLTETKWMDGSAQVLRNQPPEFVLSVRYYICMYMYVYMHVYMCVCMYICMPPEFVLSVRFYICMYMYVYMHVYMCVCVYVFMYAN